MRKTPLIVAALLASSAAAAAQSYGAGCRGQTISDLADCAAANTPPAATPVPVPETGGAAPALRPTNLGGALQPRSFRRPPPVAGRGASALPPGALASNPGQFDPLQGVTDDPASPLYGLGQDTEERQQIPRFGQRPRRSIGNFLLPGG